MRLFQDRPDWDQEGADWPNRSASRFVEAGGVTWHIQEMGAGPALALVHGTGAATHSWGPLLPILAERFHVVAMDLPGHGFTLPPETEDLSLPAMAAAVAALFETLGFEPEIAVGHSAGAAVLAALALDGRIAPARLIALNGALIPLTGAAGVLFSPLAQLLNRTAMAPAFFAARARNRQFVERLLRGTGSRTPAGSVDAYWRLAQREGHVASALRMMAQWDLEPLATRLKDLSPAVDLMVGKGDRTIRPSEALRVRALAPQAEIISIPRLGHLAHEEDPETVARAIFDRAQPAAF